MKNDKLYLQDIVMAIAKIVSYTKSGQDSFFKSTLIHVGLQEVWSVVKRDLPTLHQTILDILSSSD